MDAPTNYAIAYKGLKNETYTYDFVLGDALMAAYDNTEVTSCDCKAHVTLERATTQLVVNVAITGTVVVPCDRCLEPCTLPVNFDGQLLVKLSDEVHDYDGEVLWLSPSEDVLDLEQYLYESIILSLPFQRVHPEGECDPEMMKHFRIVSGEEFSRLEAVAPRGENDPWSALAGLKEQMEAEQE